MAKNNKTVEVMTIASQVSICEELFELVKKAGRAGDVTSLERLYKIITNIYLYSDKSDYDVFFDLGEYTFNLIDHLKNDTDTAEWNSYLDEELDATLDEMKQNT